MTVILNQEIRKKIYGELEAVIHDIILDPAFNFKIKDTRIIQTISYLNEKKINTLMITIETNNRSLLLGQFVNFRLGGMRGFHVDYLTAKIESLLESEMSDYDVELEIHFEVLPDKNQKALNYVYKNIDFQTGIRLGLLSENSKFGKEMKKYRLNWLLLAGNEISGPNYGMIKAVEEITKKHHIARCLDLFSGTGSLAKVALDNGTLFVDCVDTSTNVIHSTLEEYKGKYEVHDVDAHFFKPMNRYDLAILDPFYDHTLEVVQLMLPKYRGMVKYAILNIGLTVQRYWLSLAQNEIKKACPKTGYRDIGENTIGFLKFDHF